MLTFTRAAEVTLSAGLLQLPGMLPPQKSAQTSALGFLDGKKSLSCSEGPVPLGRQCFCTLSLPVAQAAGSMQLCQGRGWPCSLVGSRARPQHALPPLALLSAFPRPPPRFPNLCALSHGPNARQQHPPHTLLSITPASPGVRHCRHQRVPQPLLVAQSQPPALSPAPRGSSRAGPSILSSANPPSQVHPTHTRS